MAGRFLIQKFSSQMSRSRSLFSAAARSGAPASEGSISAHGNLSRGATPLVPNNAGIHGNLSHGANTGIHGNLSRGATPFVPNNAGIHGNLSHGATNNAEIHGCVGGFRTFSGMFPGAVGTVIPNNRGVHGYAARSFNALPRSRVATKTNCSTTSMPSIIINRLKPACVDSSEGAKGSFSSTASTGKKVSSSAKWAAWAAEWDAKSAAWQARRAALDAEIEMKFADFNRFVRNQVVLWGLVGSCWIVRVFLEEENGTSFCKGQSVSRGCSCCCRGQCVISKS